ncbi:small ribosomal subunit biogenesis GTPase RsgA [Geitlerinema sp. PCC 9228]|jgi:ribosome biogenesis GTPase|uniref:small ribosomal subunit biogenesis GTPase RsgA n=1 Tax=Geitlerinema sp. PCC 9228 TaxID=111611 RepID=UPI0008F9BB98|nr:small ribosomal subunit biogenesis GTPase RsgA [Geitlerinema sp. PCC 9228]
MTQTHPHASNTVRGTVLAIQANFYRVQLHPETLPTDGLDALQQPLLCTRRDRLKKIGVKVMVGDRVAVEKIDSRNATATISDVFERRNQLDRPPVANADRILLVFSLAEPEPDPYQLSRFLVKGESTGLPVLVALNKADLASPSLQQEWEQRLGYWGYAASAVSVQQNCGIQELSQHLKDRITIIAGPSGVGKSSLIHRLIPQAKVRIAAVSGKIAKGRHTTRHVELFQLPQGGLLADTPGFNQPDITCDPKDLPQYFPEIRDRLATASCQFDDCWHRQEPNCAVRGDWERYEHYLDMLAEAESAAIASHHTRTQESSLKQKTKSDHRLNYEPKLEAKKYRRRSRRSQQQELQEVCESLNDPCESLSDLSQTY